MASISRAAGLTLGAATAVLIAVRVVGRGDRNGAADRAYFGGKNILITGGSRGLGFVLAGMLLDAGAKVTICSRSATTVNAALAKFAAFDTSVAGLVCDVRERAACDRLVQQTTDRFGPIDVLINNAGIIEVGPFIDQTIADFEAAMATHFWAPLFTTLAVLPSMRARRSGHIVNVASIGGVVGVPHLAPYSASKFAQVGLTQSLGAECAADGITFTSIVPGLMLTGSPDHAVFKGRHRAEYAWFTLSDANPLLSVSAPQAARRILRAIRRREAQAVIGLPAQMAKTLNALLPETTARLLQITAALLPAPGGIGSTSRSGAQSQSSWTQNVLTYFNRRAMRATNQEPADAPMHNDAEPTKPHL